MHVFVCVQTARCNDKNAVVYTATTQTAFMGIITTK